jgi:NADH-quinone oxidoreductase subunit M
MFLSGFLVKTALFGYYKLVFCFDSTDFQIIPCVIIILGIVDSSLKMFAQIDLKKLIAYCTIQEMNMIFLIIIFGGRNNLQLCIAFSFMHGILSSYMFFIVDCVYRKTNTRSIYELSGLVHVAPNLSIFIFIMVILYSGFPLTLKFYCEVYLITTLFYMNQIVMVLLFVIISIVSILSFSITWFGVIFGTPKKHLVGISDLTSKEILILVLNIFLLVITVKLT